MARAYSAAYKSTLAAVSAPEAPLILMEISHADLAAPVRVVNDTQNIVSNGDTFIAAPFRGVLPDDVEGQLARARIAIDNVGRDLMYWIEASSGGQGAEVRLMQVMRSRPDLIEWEVTLDLMNVRATMAEVSGELGYENVYMRPAVQLRYDPQTAPGLF
jgi:hypothetical protein